MPRYADYIPAKDSLFLNWQNNLVSKVVANAPAWGIAPAAVTDLQAAQAVYVPKYNAITNKNNTTSTQLLGHRNARTAYTKTLRLFIGQYLRYNVAVSNAPRNLAGLTVPKGTRSIQPHITDPPSCILETMRGALVHLVCRRPEDITRSSLHPHATDLELRYIVSATPIEFPNQCTNTHISTRTKFILRFEQTDAGKKVYSCARWRNATHADRSGPFSQVVGVMVVE